MFSDIILLADEIAGLATGSSPEDLTAQHELWAADVAHFSPWREDSCAVFDEGVRCWRSEAPSSGLAASPVLVAGACSSSLDITWRLAACGSLPAWGTVLAASQWSGRGQLRRAWISPPGNVHAALALPADWPAGRQFASELTPLLVGLMLVAGFEALGVAVQLKWPNDILYEEKKVCGILIEERGGLLIAGVGANLAFAPAAAVLARDPWATPTGTLPRELLPFGPLRLWRRLGSLGREYLETRIHGLKPAALIALLESKLAWMGREVVMMGAGLASDGKCFDKRIVKIVGLCVDGSLRIRADGAERRVSSGSLLSPV